MKKLQLLTTLLCLSGLFFIARGQELIESFDAVATDTTYNQLLEAPSTITLTDEATDKVEGAGSLRFRTILASVHDWGTYGQIQKLLPEATYFDWSTKDSLSLWIKVTMAPSIPASFVFRIHLADRPDPEGNTEEYIYENGTVIDAVSEWINLKVPLNEREVDSGNPDETGFILFPAAWGRSGTQENNLKLDYDKIIGFNITAVSTTNAADSVEYLLDKFEATGLVSVPAVLFNGKILGPRISNTFAWGQSSVGIEEDAGPVAGTDAVKWIQGDEWANGWTGFGYDILPTFNLSLAWQTDSVKFKMKCEEGVGILRMQFEGGTGKVGTVFTPVADNQWHQYSLPLREMVYQDATTGFDSSNIHVVGLMAEASAVAGKVVYITDWWTGNPIFDVVPPVSPAGLAAIPGSYTNLITWTDVPQEEGETYSLYYSKNPITDVEQAEVVNLKIEENVQLFEHVLRAPATDQSVSYYYAITCTDESGNVSDPAPLGSSVANTAQGVVTLSLNPPAAFTADGDLSEWAGITPIHMAPSGGGYIVTNTTIDGDADLSLDAYIAIDNTYLYVALDVEDDVVSHSHATSYLNDAPDLFLGLYNWHGVPHTGYKRGAQPDYHFRFAFDRALVDGVAGGDSLLVPGDDYFWGEKFPTGYTVEARIPLQELATRFSDNLFVPYEGFRIPIDFSINDADATGEREGILTYSPFNEDLSYADVSRWLYTWVGNLWEPVGVDDDVNTVNTYSLAQNYPNPFNPATQINYTLEKPGLVTLKVYDLLGSLVTTLVNEQQNSGLHTVNFNASTLTSGIYFYQITSGSFTSTKKMILVK